jgi:hypothetical protein
MAIPRTSHARHVEVRAAEAAPHAPGARPYRHRHTRPARPISPLPGAENLIPAYDYGRVECRPLHVTEMPALGGTVDREREGFAEAERAARDWTDPLTDAGLLDEARGIRARVAALASRSAKSRSRREGPRSCAEMIGPSSGGAGRSAEASWRTRNATGERRFGHWAASCQDERWCSPRAPPPAASHSL